MTANNCELTVIGSSRSSMLILFTSISPYSPMHQTATLTKLPYTYQYKIGLCTSDTEFNSMYYNNTNYFNTPVHHMLAPPYIMT
jgi:hypothetical protein